VRLLQLGADGVDAGPRALLLFGLMNLFVGALSLVPIRRSTAAAAVRPRPRAPPGGRRRATTSSSRTSASLWCSLCCSSRSGGRRPIVPAVLDPLVSPLARLVTGG
jgi:hypothetical protein